MASSLVDNIIRLKSMLSDMEQDFGLTDLSIVEKNVYLAAQDIKAKDGTVETKHILEHNFTQNMSRPTFFRALKSIQEKGLIKNAPKKKLVFFLLIISN